MKNFIVRVYDQEMCKVFIDGFWESESAMLNDLMKQGYKVIEWWELGIKNKG